MTLNAGIGQDRVKPAAGQEAADENGGAISDELSEAIAGLRKNLTDDED